MKQHRPDETPRFDQNMNSATLLDLAIGTPLSPSQASNAFTQIELKRINLLIYKRLIHQATLYRQESAPLRGLSVGFEQVSDFLAKKDDGNDLWAATPQAILDLQERYLNLLEESTNLLEDAEQPALLRLADTFGLNPFEYHVLLVCLANALDSGYGQVFGFLHDDLTRKYPSKELLLNLLVTSDEEPADFLPYLQENSRLFRFNIIQSIASDSDNRGLRASLALSEEIANWLSGNYSPPVGLSNAVSVDKAPEVDLLLVDQEILSYDSTQLALIRPLVWLFGPDDTINRASANYLISKLDQSIFVIDLVKVKAVEELNERVLASLLRDARLNDAVPLLLNSEVIIDEQSKLASKLIQQLLDFDGILFAIGSKPLVSLTGMDKDRKSVFTWNILLPDGQKRRQIWSECINANTDVSPTDLSYLADQFELSSSQIYQAWAMARDISLKEQRRLNISDLYEAARQCSSHELDKLAVKVAPRFGWGDIVLPNDEISVLHEIVAMVRDRSMVLEDWGLGQKLVSSKGIAALFAGDPGTGKTLAAQVIAKELAMDLYKIDLSTVVSKYIGETEKNLELIFTQARNSNAILFFDEADAIFGKRSEVKDAHDRYANIEVGYLLQRMETYDGIVILATNLHSNMDEAFTRRLQFVVNFPFPDAVQREAIWKVLFPPLVPKDEGIDFHKFSKTFEMAGGNIRNVIVYACFQAANEKKAVSSWHLMQGIRREMKKMGRLIDEKEYAGIRKGQ